MTIEPAIHPFPGLRHFEASEEHLFFGREGQSEEILSRLSQHRFLAVVGSSGSGKSSLIRAGLLPYLHGGFLASTGSHWRVAIFRPGGDPIRNLAVALNDPAVLGKPNIDPTEAAQDTVLLEVSLRRSGLGLIEAVRLARLRGHEQVLIVVDQFEELFRFANTSGDKRQSEDAAAFVKLLLEASEQQDVPIYVVLTMRSDFIGDCARYRSLPETVSAGLYLIPRMTRDQRRAAIVEPVRVGGGSIAPRLVNRLLNDVGDDPDQLPILQHALMRTWDYWQAHGGDQRPIDIEDYRATGGMAEALSQHADEAYDGLADDRLRTITRRLFQALTEKGADNREARRPTTIEMLALVTGAPVSDIIAIVEEFRQPGRSFLMPPVNVTLEEGTIVDISHESLIRGWRRLRKWVDEEAESAKVYRRLAETAGLFAQGTAGLWHDPDLEHALAWRNQERPTAAWGHRYHPGFEQAMAFLEQSRIARETERRQKETVRRRTQAASLAATFLLGIIAAVALWQWQTAGKERDQAQRALSMTTQIANTLVFDMGQDPRVKALPQDVLHQLFDRAIQGYNETIEINPNADAFNGRGSAYQAKGDLDHAIADYGEAIRLDPDYASAVYNRGIAFRDKGDLDHAIADYDEAITLDPKFATAFNSRGDAYQAKGDLDHAIGDYNQAIVLDAKFAIAFNNRGNAYVAKNDMDLALVDYSQAITLDPKYALAFDNRGNIYRAKNDLDHALADYDQAIKLDNRYAVAYGNRGDAYQAKGDFDRAIADYNRAILLNQKDAVAFDNRGTAFQAKGNLDQAMADYDRAIMLDPQLAVAFDNRGNAYSTRSDPDHAIADFNQAIAFDPKFAVAFDNRGNAYRDKGDLDHAIADYSQAIALDPKDTTAFDDRADAYQAKNDFDSAIADYDQALTLDPKDAVALYNRGIAHKAKGDLDQSAADYDQAALLDPKDADTYKSRNNAYRSKDDSRNQFEARKLAMTPRAGEAEAERPCGRQCGRGGGESDQGRLSGGAGAQRDGTERDDATLGRAAGRT